jgi:hypothetical protein
MAWPFFVVRLDVRIHERFQVMRGHAAGQNDPHRVGEEMDRVVIFNEAGILGKKAAFFDTVAGLLSHGEPLRA